MRCSQRLRKALERSEFSLAYQPIVTFGVTPFVEVEALLRWPSDPRRMETAEIVHAAESRGLIGGIGQWVIDEACRQLAQWRRDVIDAARLRVAVNVSPLQFRPLEEDLAETVATTLSAHGLIGADLCIEITEGAPLAIDRTTATTLDELRRIGVELAIDDFGSGFGGLDTFGRIDVQRIKFAAELVQALPDSRRARAVVAAVIDVARHFDVDCVAEGIESVSHLAAAREVGFGRGQGFAFVPPLAPEDLIELLAAAAAPGANGVPWTLA